MNDGIDGVLDKIESAKPIGLLGLSLGSFAVHGARNIEHTYHSNSLSDFCFGRGCNGYMGVVFSINQFRVDGNVDGVGFVYLHLHLDLDLDFWIIILFQINQI